ncbi:hypothetical protein ANN_19748 [Periplaneta americana]|uniref:Endonuclease-reverse transcriptase n=1 Tax=Periplaneta americana TaxID=6978 RepID=A0ABQ8SB46_PERAM|nr:hypothetical protein ANN_19748 [Periplaneta americana]
MDVHSINAMPLTEVASKKKHVLTQYEELVGSLVEKKLSIEGCTGRNGEREKSSGQKNVSDVEKFKYLGATVTNINDTREEIKHRINMGNACYYSVEKLLSSNLLSKNLKVRIYKTVILPVVLYDCETWTLNLREEHRLRVLENKVEKFKYLGATVTNINDTREEIKHRINMGNACYYSVEKLLSSNLLSKNLKVRIYKTVILPVVLYDCGTWTLNLREEHRLRVLENKVLRKIFGAKRDEVTGEWRKLHNTELHALYSSPDIIRNIKSRYLRWARHVARMGESRNAYRVLVGRPEGKRPLGRSRRRWEDNIKMDLKEVGNDDRDWINLAQDRDQWRVYVRAAMNLREEEKELGESVAEKKLPTEGCTGRNGEREKSSGKKNVPDDRRH